MTETMFGVLLFAAISLIFTGLAMDKKAVLFGVLATVTPLWELGQVVNGSGLSNQVILTSAYDSATTSFHDYLISAALPEVFLALLVTFAAVVTINMAFEKESK